MWHKKEGQDLVEMLARNQLVVVNSFQKRESHKITHRSGKNRTGIYLLIVRRCQRNKVKDCKVLAGEHIKSQHKPLVYEMWIGKGKQRRRKQRQVIRWWKDELVEKYKSGVDRKFRLIKEQRKQSGQHLRKALLEQMRRYVAEHQESPHKAKITKNSGGGTRKLNKLYNKRRRH